MSKAPRYWTKAKKILSKKDKVMARLILSYKDGSLITRNDVFFSLCKRIISMGGHVIVLSRSETKLNKLKEKYESYSSTNMNVLE